MVAINNFCFLKFVLEYVAKAFAINLHVVEPLNSMIPISRSKACSARSVNYHSNEKEVNIQRNVLLSIGTAITRYVSQTNALVLSFKCSTDSDKYNPKNFAFKNKVFEFDLSNINSPSKSVFEFETSRFGEQNGPVKQDIF